MRFKFPLSNRSGWQDFIFVTLSNPVLQHFHSASDYDAIFVVSAFWVAEFPLDRGKRFDRNMSRWLDAKVGGWQVRGTHRA